MWEHILAEDFNYQAKEFPSDLSVTRPDSLTAPDRLISNIQVGLLRTRISTSDHMAILKTFKIEKLIRNLLRRSLSAKTSKLMLRKSGKQ
jgi:hypothetical protein